MLTLLVTEEMVEDIVKYTNKRIDTMVDSMSPEQLANNNLRDKYRYFMHHTDQLEMKAFFGLCYMRG